MVPLTPQFAVVLGVFGPVPCDCLTTLLSVFLVIAAMPRSLPLSVLSGVLLSELSALLGMALTPFGLVPGALDPPAGPAHSPPPVSGVLALHELG